MKDYRSLPKKIKKHAPKIHIFDAVIIVFLLNIVALTLVVLYVQRIKSFSLPSVYSKYLKVNSVPLSPDLSSINASAEAYVVYDVSSRTVIAGKNQDLRFAPASTAKVMTAILAIEHYNLDQILTVPWTVYSVQGSKMNLVPGEQISVTNLIYGMLLPSGNDAAYTLAYNYPGGVPNFVYAMNRKAQDLKLENTYFIDPAGYEDGNYTTGAELARLGAYAMEKKFFTQVVKTKYIQLSNATNTHQFFLTNLNELLRYNNIVGIKTGFTNEAGGVLLTAVNKDGKLLVVSVLKSQDRFSDTQDLMNFIQEKVDFSVPKSN